VRRLMVVGLVVIGGCVAVAPVVGSGGVLPETLSRLLINRDHPSMSAVDFPHARHVSAAACVDCHHEVDGDAEAVPASCTTCHVLVDSVPEHDEDGLDHPPDL